MLQVGRMNIDGLQLPGWCLLLVVSVVAGCGGVDEAPRTSQAQSLVAAMVAPPPPPAMVCCQSGNWFWGYRYTWKPACATQGGWPLEDPVAASFCQQETVTCCEVRGGFGWAHDAAWCVKIGGQPTGRSKCSATAGNVCCALPDRSVTNTTYAGCAAASGSILVHPVAPTDPCPGLAADP